MENDTIAGFVLLTMCFVETGVNVCSLWNMLRCPRRLVYLVVSVECNIITCIWDSLSN